MKINFLLLQKGFQKRCFSGTGMPQNNEKIPLVYGKIHGVDGLDHGGFHRVGLGEILAFDDHVFPHCFDAASGHGPGG